MRTLARCTLVGPLVVGLATACTSEPPHAETRLGVVPAKAFAPRIVPLNAEVAREARVDAIRPGGATGFALTGDGVLLAEWDEAAARDTHRDLIGRVNVRDGAGLSDHSSHVAATIAGSGVGDLLALGMAPRARLFSYSWELDLVEIAGVGPFVSASSHAYGSALGWQVNPACPELGSWAGERGAGEDGRFGRYDAVAAALDRVVRETDLLSIWAAGNDRDDGPPNAEDRHAHFPSCDATFSDEHGAERDLEYDTLGGGAVAKNVLSVGAIGDLPDTFGPSDITPLAASSFGPTDDGRIKPDLVAGGDDVRSASGNADDAYENESGTSSAAAAVTGIAALLVEQYRSGHSGRDPRASELKAVLVQTAADAGTPGPDYGMGYGLVDARAAANFLDADSEESRLRVDALAGSANELVTPEVAEGTALRVTLAWLDPPGPTRTLLDDPAPVLENDLDLSLVAPDGTTIFHPWSLARERPDAAATRDSANHVDNVEVVDVDAEDNTWTGAWTVRVEASRALLRDDPQAYALAASVPIATPGRPIVGSATRLRLELPPSGSATLAVPIENLGRGTLNWTATSDAPFIELTQASGAGGDELVFRASGSEIAGTEPGFATIRLDSSDPGGPRTLGVLVERPCAPDCSGRECGLEPVCGTPCGRCASRSACTADGICVPFADACPTADLGTALGSALVSGTTAGQNTLSASCGGELGPDLGFAWTAPRAGRYSFSTEGSHFDTVLSVRRDGCNGSEIACNDDTLDLASSVVVDLDTGEAVTAVVDGFNGESGTFSLGIHELTCPDGELDSTLGKVLPETSPGRLDRLRASCAADVAREAALGFTAPVDGTYRFDVSASNYEPSVAVLRDDCAGEELACGLDNVEVPLFAGARVIVVIDGASAPDDRFALDVTTRSLTCGGDCSARPGDGLCACDERCVELGDCCVDACGDCASCTPDQECEFGRCIPRRCIGTDCGCGAASGGTGAAGCDAGAGGAPGEAGGPATEEPDAAVEPSGCSCATAGGSPSRGLAWLGFGACLVLLASRRGRI